MKRDYEKELKGLCESIGISDLTYKIEKVKNEKDCYKVYLKKTGCSKFLSFDIVIWIDFDFGSYNVELKNGFMSGKQMLNIAIFFDTITHK